ncbi:MAG TPA: hypothetical protein PLP01_09590 [Phycisphaerae bacterium]|nr:hypothetical protein [Phycisphaerae bacterium]HOI55488.1 hypothetical protein [Phycisphaerae bacterium]
MNDEKVSAVWRRATVAAGLLLLGLMAGVLWRESPRESDPELARAARQAIETAREAQSRNDAAYLAAGRYRLAAVAVGVTVPLVAAVVLVVVCRRGAASLGGQNECGSQK